MTLEARESDAPRAEEYFTFRVGEVIYAVPRRAVLDVLPLVQESVPRHLTWGSIPYPVVDPRRLFGLHHAPPNRQVLFLNDRETRSALIIDRPHDPVTVHENRFQAVPWHFGGREQLWFQGVAALDDHRALVLLSSRGLLTSFRTLDGGTPS